MYTPDITTNLEYIFSGRMVKEIDAVDGEKAVSYGIHNLGDILTREEQRQLDENSKYTPFEIVVKAGTLELVFGNIEVEYPKIRNKLSRIVQLNTFSSEHRREMGSTKVGNVGTVWLRVMEADGNIYYKGVKINRFDENIDDNSPVAKKILQIIHDLVENKDTTKEDWKIYLGRLSRFLYTSAAKSHKMFLHLDGADKFFLIGTDEGPTRKIFLDEEDAEERIYQAIKNEGYRFNLVADNSSTNAVENLSLLDIVASNMISTDLARVHNVGASFLISQYVTEEGKLGKVVDSEVAEELRKGTLVHTGRKDIYNAEVSTMPIQLDYGDMKGHYFKGRLDDDKKYHFYLIENEKGSIYPINKDKEVTDPLTVKLLTTKLLLDYLMKNEKLTLEDLARGIGEKIGGIKYTYTYKNKKIVYAHIYIPISVPNRTRPVYMDENGRVIFPERSKKYKDEYDAIVKLGQQNETSLKANEFLNKAGRNANLVLNTFEEAEDKTITVTVINSAKKEKAKEGDFSYLYIGRDDIIASQEDFNYLDSDTLFKIKKLVFKFNAKTGAYELLADVYLSDGTETRKDSKGEPIIFENVLLKLNGPSNLGLVIDKREKWNPSLIGNPILEVMSTPIDEISKKGKKKATTKKGKTTSSNDNSVLTIPTTGSSLGKEVKGLYLVVLNEDNSLTVTYDGDPKARARINGNLVPDFANKPKALGINLITIAPDGEIQIQSDLSSNFNQPELLNLDILRQIIKELLPDLSEYLELNTKLPTVSVQDIAKQMDKDKSATEEPSTKSTPTSKLRRRPTVKPSTAKKLDKTVRTREQLIESLFLKLKGRYDSFSLQDSPKNISLKDVLNSLLLSTLEQLENVSVEDAKKIFTDNKYCWYPF